MGKENLKKHQRMPLLLAGLEQDPRIDAGLLEPKQRARRRRPQPEVAAGNDNEPVQPAVVVDDNDAVEIENPNPEPVPDEQLRAMENFNRIAHEVDEIRFAPAPPVPDEPVDEPVDAGDLQDAPIAEGVPLMPDLDFEVRKQRAIRFFVSGNG